MKKHQYSQSKFQLVSFFIVLLITGCGSIQIGRDFNVKAFESMAKVDETTNEAVRKVLGEPKSSGISINGNGERLVEWVYFYGAGKVSKMDEASLKILQVRFNKNGKLRSYSWSNSDQQK